jgi:hypothetical protein
MWVLQNLTSFQLEKVLVSVQDRCKVCAKCTIGLQIVLDAPDGTLWSRDSSESPVCLEIVLIFTQDRCMICIKRTMGQEIILDAPDRTPT